jgi:hypothetical protein
MCSLVTYFKKMFTVEFEDLTINVPEGLAENHENLRIAVHAT